MNRVFADTFFWIALTDPKDQWHQAAVMAGRKLATATLVTTDDVLDEFLAYFSGFGPLIRLRCVTFVKSLLSDPTVEALSHDRQSFLAGLSLYESRPDKSYSLTDCISMATMPELGITQVLTHDVHFSQEGFTKLL
jgi:predicted nucleic acid-binding protein